MFRTQNWKQVLGLMVLGSVFTIIWLSLSPVTAHRDKFGVIECTVLRVVDADGHLGVVLGVGDQGGFVNVNGKDYKSAAELGIDEHGGSVTAVGKDSKFAGLSITEHGGRVYASGKDGKAMAALGVTDHGGAVGVYGKREGQAIMGINEYGNGAVSSWDKNGYRQ